jgi:hypothetical protein
MFLLFFNHFKFKLKDNFFTKTKSVQMDWGGEYKKIKNSF